jgi:uncharacterized membrane protein YkvA (DUF1232 family)
MNNVLQRIQDWAKALKRQVMVLWFSCRHPQTPLLPKVLAIVVVAYALSPIDLIPDFIPILGYLDDVILVPLGVWLLIRLMPAGVLEECRKQAAEQERNHIPRPKSLIAGILIVLIWLAVVVFCWHAASSLGLASERDWRWHYVNPVT